MPVEHNMSSTWALNPVNEQIGGLCGNVKQKFSPQVR